MTILISGTINDHFFSVILIRTSHVLQEQGLEIGYLQYKK